jgi:hypothetical protein
MKATTLLLRLSALAMALTIAPSAFAQAWPTKPVRLVALAEMDLRLEGYSTQEAQRRSQEGFAKWGTVARRTQLQLD